MIEAGIGTGLENRFGWYLYAIRETGVGSGWLVAVLTRRYDGTGTRVKGNV